MPTDVVLKIFKGTGVILLLPPCKLSSLMSLIRLFLVTGRFGNSVLSDLMFLVRYSTLVLFRLFIMLLPALLFGPGDVDMPLPELATPWLLPP